MPIPVKYDTSARCPEFVKFLYDITATDDDRLSIIDFLASLLISQPMDFFVAAPGLGSNGRSKLKDFIRAFIGSDACRSIPLKDLSNRFTSGFLTRCRVNFCNETEIGGIILEFIKRSGEKMPVEQKFKGMVNALLYLKYFFDTNTMPGIIDTSYGAERRLCRWDLPWRFVDNPNPENSMEKQRDPDIISRITTEEELSGVLNMVLERAPVVIKQRMVHHKDGGLQEYVLQSRSGDVFVELFLEPTINNNDRVHIDTIRNAYQEYCVVTNSSVLRPMSMRTLIEGRLCRSVERNLRIGDANRSGFSGLKFDEKLFKRTIDLLGNARKEGKPVFKTLLLAFPDIQNSTLSTQLYTNSTYETAISNTLCRIVEKYRVEKEKRKKKPDDSPARIDPLQTLQTLQNQQKEATDSDSNCRVFVESSLPGVEDHRLTTEEVVEEFLQDGGKGSLKRFLTEFPAARRPEDAVNGL